MIVRGRVNGEHLCHPISKDQARRWRCQATAQGDGKIYSLTSLKQLNSDLEKSRHTCTSTHSTRNSAYQLQKAFRLSSTRARQAVVRTSYDANPWGRGVFMHTVCTGGGGDALWKTEKRRKTNRKTDINSHANTSTEIHYKNSHPFRSEPLVQNIAHCVHECLFARLCVGLGMWMHGAGSLRYCVSVVTDHDYLSQQISGAIPT